MSVTEARRVIREADLRKTPEARRLQAAEKAYREAVQKAERLRLARNEMVAQATARGLTRQDVAALTGLGHQRVGQIVKQEEARAAGTAEPQTTTRGDTPHAAADAA